MQGMLEFQMFTSAQNRETCSPRNDIDNNEVDSSPSIATMWFLSGRLRPNDPIHHIPIDATPFLVGRSSEVALSLPSRTVSSVHAELVNNGLTLTVRDLDSTNGTFINGERISGSVALKPEDIVQFADIPFRLMIQSARTDTVTESQDVCDQALALVQFDRLMSDEAVVPHYQSIVDLRSKQIIGYEVLGRSRIPHLESPAAMFSAAAHFNLETKLSQMFRWKAVQETMSLSDLPHLFLNTHPIELEQPGLIESMKSLRELNIDQQITLEVHEGAVTNPATLRELRAALKELNIGLAFDDFGSGQTRLAELAVVHPEYLKFDISLIRSIDMATAEQKEMVATLVRMVKDLGVIALAEGIETEEECATCVALGFELAQGYYFGRPTPLIVP